MSWQIRQTFVDSNRSQWVDVSQCRPFRLPTGETLLITRLGHGVTVDPNREPIYVVLSKKRTRRHLSALVSIDALADLLKEGTGDPEQLAVEPPDDEPPTYAGEL